MSNQIIGRCWLSLKQRVEKTLKLWMKNDPQLSDLDILDEGRMKSQSVEGKDVLGKEESNQLVKNVWVQSSCDSWRKIRSVPEL